MQVKRLKTYLAGVFIPIVGSWQLAVGSWQLAAGSWQLARSYFFDRANSFLLTAWMRQVANDDIWSEFRGM